MSGADVASLEPDMQSESGIGDHGLGSLRQQGQIGRVIADVVKGLRAEVAAQGIEFFVARKVADAIGTEDAREDAEMVGDAAGKRVDGAVAADAVMCDSSR